MLVQCRKRGYSAPIGFCVRVPTARAFQPTLEIRNFAVRKLRLSQFYCCLLSFHVAVALRQRAAGYEWRACLRQQPKALRWRRISNRCRPCHSQLALPSSRLQDLYCATLQTRAAQRHSRMHIYQGVISFAFKRRLQRQTSSQAGPVLYVSAT